MKKGDRVVAALAITPGGISRRRRAGSWDKGIDNTTTNEKEVHQGVRDQRREE